MGGRGWKALAAGTVAAVAVHLLLPAGPWAAGPWAAAAVGLVAAVTAGLAARGRPRAERLPWWCLAVGVGAHAIGGTPAAHDLSIDSALQLLLFPAATAGLALLVRQRERRRHAAAVVDAATAATGFALVGWVTVVAPAAGGGAAPPVLPVLPVLNLVGAVLLAAVTVRLLHGTGARGPAYWWLVASITALVASPVGGPLPLLGYAALGLAALHPGAHRLARTTARPARPLGALHITLTTLAVSTVPALLTVPVLLGGGRDATVGPALAVGATALAGLVVTRLTQLGRHVARQGDRLRELARHDELTGLPNRRAWQDELPRALEYARRDGRPVSVAVVDLDHFAIYNDCYGHPAGDGLLRAAAQAWRAELRACDLLARFGGEEFVLLFPGSDTATASVALHRLQGATPLGQHFSAGVATWDGTETSQQLVHRADVALRAAKAAGRNRVVPAAADLPAPAVDPAVVLTGTLTAAPDLSPAR